MMIRSLLLLAALAACGSRNAESPGPEARTPVDVAALEEQLVSATPGATAFSAKAEDGFGVTVATDGTGSFADPATGTMIETTVSSFFDNTICMAEVGDWPGLCIDLFEDQTGAYLCEGTFGNGDLRNFACRIEPVGDDT